MAGQSRLWEASRRAPGCHHPQLFFRAWPHQLSARHGGQRPPGFPLGFSNFLQQTFCHSEATRCQLGPLVEGAGIGQRCWEKEAAKFRRSWGSSGPCPQARQTEGPLGSSCTGSRQSGRARLVHNEHTEGANTARHRGEERRTAHGQGGLRGERPTLSLQALAMPSSPGRGQQPGLQSQWQEPPCPTRQTHPWPGQGLAS